MKLLVLLLLLYEQFVDYSENEPIVKILNGKIRGKTVTNIYNRTFYAFLDIPYASPPIGNLRFQEAIEANNWEGILNTTENRKICWEVSASHTKKLQNKTEENEDCLYLNVYTPQLPNSNSKLYPVVVYIYGGQFAYGNVSFESYDPQLMVDCGIIFITFNFRSGPLGFLTTNDGVITSNLGLKDQNFVLKWVQKNIAYFGGDPSKVTLMGHSSGAVSVAFHVLSRRSAGLFRSAIIQSATALQGAATTPFSKNYAYQMGTKLSSDFTDKNSSQDLLHLLRNVPANDLCNITLTPRKMRTFFANSLNTIWKPVIEDANDRDAFVTGPMHDDLLNGRFNKISVLMGITSEEILFYAKKMGINTWIKGLDESSDAILRDDGAIIEKDMAEYGSILKKIYTNTTFQDKPTAMYRYLSDALFTVPIVRHAQLQSKYSNVYFYQFSYYGEKNVIKGFEHPIDVKGLGNVGHAEELFYLFLKGPDRVEREKRYPSMDILIRDRMVKLWTNFIKHINPTPKEDPLLENVRWPKLTEDNFTYLDIDKKLTLISDYPKEYKKWLPLIGKYHRHPIANI